MSLNNYQENSLQNITTKFNFVLILKSTIQKQITMSSNIPLRKKLHLDRKKIKKEKTENYKNLRR